MTAPSGPRLASPSRPSPSELRSYLAALGLRCRQARLASGLSPADLQAAGWSRQYIHRVESGRGITVATLLRLARLYRVQPADLLPRFEEASPRRMRTRRGRTPGAGGTAR
jgi:transcriptional regulator with XRE-family HTH domain